MLMIKTIKNGVESDWFWLTKKKTRILLKEKPEAVIVYAESLYKNSPDSGTLIVLEFQHFAVIVRDSVLLENRLQKQQERYHDKRPLDQIDPSEYSMMGVWSEEDYISREEFKQLDKSKELLTPIQHKRLRQYIEMNMTFREIAEKEKVHFTTVEESVNQAIKKMKKYLE